MSKVVLAHWMLHVKFKASQAPSVSSRRNTAHLFLKWEQSSLQSKKPDSSSSPVYFFFSFHSKGPCSLEFILSFLPSRLWSSLWSCLTTLCYNFPVLICFLTTVEKLAKNPTPVLTTAAEISHQAVHSGLSSPASSSFVVLSSRL